MSVPNWEAKVAAARDRLREAQHRLDDACAEISSIVGLAGEWDQIRTQSIRVAALREKFDARIARRRASLQQMNGGDR